ncbi:MAG: LruC domain-containing protein [Lentimicrobium sp.]
MKKEKFICGLVLILLMPFISQATVGGVSQDFESGNRVIERGYCWQFIGTSISSSNKISGNYSGYSSALNNPNDPRRFISPWIEFSGSDQIEFNHKVTSLNGATAHYLRVSLIDTDGNITQILDYTYPNTQVQSVVLPVSVTGIFQVQWLFTGTGGGSSRGVLDDIIITGSYMADPTNNPGGSGACAVMQTESDADGDGVPDEEDAYPEDPLRAFNTYTPANGMGSLAFEDMWPGMGDYDFNDLVVYYRINQITNSSNEVVEIEATYITQAVGAGFKNGLGFMLPVPAGSVASCTGSHLSGNFISLAASGLESGQQNAVVIVFDNAHTTFTGVSGTNPEGYAGINTSIGGRTGTGEEILISLQFDSPINQALLGNPPYNPFLIVNSQRNIEVHLPDFPPTDLADTDLFGTGQDNSNPSQGIYYRSNDGLPWALNITDEFDYPIEKSQISEGHLKFIDWAISGGLNYSGWYLNQNGNRNPNKVYNNH